MKEDVENLVTCECLLNIAISSPASGGKHTWNWISVWKASREREWAEREMRNWQARKGWTVGRTLKIIVIADKNRERSRSVTLSHHPCTLPQCVPVRQKNIHSPDFIEFALSVSHIDVRTLLYLVTLYHLIFFRRLFTPLRYKSDALPEMRNFRI